MAKSVASKMIEIECPNCKAMLELDRGFAGGVCRCSKCGTLMTVPEDPSREKAETLSRPDAPPGGRRPASPPGRKPASPRPQSPAANNASRPGAPTPRINTPTQSTQQQAQARPQSPAPSRPGAPTPSVKPAASAGKPAPPAPPPTAQKPEAPKTQAPRQQQASPQAAAQTAQTSHPAAAHPPAKPAATAPVSKPAPSTVKPTTETKAAAATPPTAPSTTPPPPVTPAPEPEEVEELEAEIIEDDVTVKSFVERVPEPVKTQPAQPATPAEPTPTPAPRPDDDFVEAEADTDAQAESVEQVDAGSDVVEVEAEAVHSEEEPEEPHQEDLLHAADDEEVFQTASGKIIRVKKNRIVTAQTKRKVIRASIMTVIGIAVAGLLVIAFSVLYLLTRNTGPTEEELLRQRQEAVNRTFGYDPNKNPFLMTQPNYLGIPLKKSFAVVIDASSSTQKWFGLAADAGPVGIKHANGSVNGIFAIAADGGPKFYPDTAKPIDVETAESIAASLMNTYPGGVGDIGKTVDATLTNQPQQLIIVSDDTGIKPAMINKLKELMETRPDVTLDIISIDSTRRNPELEKLVETHKGRYLLLTEGKIKDWRNETP